MQLASTLFGIVVIQIKPQLEKLLNLPQDSLTKEIRMVGLFSFLPLFSLFSPPLFSPLFSPLFFLFYHFQFSYILDSRLNGNFHQISNPFGFNFLY